MADAPETARAWIEHLLDPGWTLLFDDIVSTDPLAFPWYPQQLERAREATGENESVLVAEGTIHGDVDPGLDVVLVAFEFGFLGGSMGVAAGERIARAFEHAAAMRRPVIALTASGGARMQEGMAALAQMPATIAARRALADAHRPFLAYLRNPTTGGVFASFASSADLIWAEPGATIGFAGPRIVETQTGETITDSHTAEHAFDAGLIDQLVEPRDLKGMLIALRWLQSGRAPRAGEPPAEPAAPAVDAWGALWRARDPARRALDRAGGSLPMRSSDPSVMCGFAQIGGSNVVAILLDASHPLRAPGKNEDPARIPARPIPPTAYRDARHAIAVASRLALPIVTFIDTAGADPRSPSERAGIAREIDRTFEALLEAPVPTVACVTGEGGSGGALAFAACDRLLIQRDAVFSVIAPEAAAAILGREDVADLSAQLKIGAHDLRALGLADLVVDEPEGGAVDDPDAARAALHAAIAWALADAAAEGAPTERRTRRWRLGM
jgi:acetyl-CoA carboxylase carboxyl transferase subunit beta